MRTLETHKLYDKMILATNEKEDWNKLFYLEWRTAIVAVYWYDEDGLQDTFYNIEDAETYIKNGSWKILAKREVE